MRMSLSIAVLVTGCNGDARVELSAASALDRIASGMAVAVSEYHRDIEAADDRREAAVIDAFIERIRRDHPDEQMTAEHAFAFRDAMDRLRHDRRVEWERFLAVSNNLTTLLEITDGLRRLAVESMTLSDEARRYLRELVTAEEPATALLTGESHVPSHGVP
jgi:hypothetical protein